MKLPRRRPSSADFYAVAKHGRRVPDAEIAIAEVALSGSGPVGERIVSQLREARDVWRHSTADGTYELRISTTDDLTIDDVPSGGGSSRWIPLIAGPDARPIELRLVVLEAGIVEILGRAADARRWPKTWTARPEDLAAIRRQAPWLDLPTQTGIVVSRRAAERAIGTWLGDPGALHAVRAHLSARPPATSIAIDALATTERLRLPEAYRSLLEVANGIKVGGLSILGTRDAYRLDIPGPGRLVICPPDEDGAIGLAETGEVVHIDVDDETSDGQSLAPDLRVWLLGRLD